jgi:hypothetical protein
MKFLKRINLLVLITFFMSSVPVTPVFAIQTAGKDTLGAQFEGAATVLRDIYSLKYLDGDKGQHRNAPILEKITHHPERALATVAVYGLTLLAAKKLYDFAEKRGIFNRIFDDLLNQPEQPARHRNPQPAVRPAPRAQPVLHVRPAPQVRPAPRVQPARPVQQVNRPPHNGRGMRNPRRANRPRTQNNRPQPRPNNQQRPAAQPAPQPHNNVRIANPLPGQQLHLNGLPNHLPGFYHMRSATPYQGVHQSCGINAAYNMALVEAQVAGRHVDNNAFNNALNNTALDRRIRIAGQPRNQGNHQVLRDMLGRRGFSNNEIAGLTRNLGLAPMTVLVNARAHGPNNRFNGANGPQVQHFLCNVPGHWISISVVRHADGTQAMYLYDNLNGHARSIPEMRAHVEAIYNRFF